MRSGSMPFAFGVILLIAILWSPISAREVTFGFVEAGPYPWHGMLRDVFRQEISNTAPDSITPVFPAAGFVSSDWDREASRRKLGVFVSQDPVDIVIAIGPWAAEDLLAAGYTKPIIAIGRFDPEGEGLLDANNRPVAANLTVTSFSGRFRKDLAALATLIPGRTLGVLLFPGDSLGDSTLARVTQAAAEYGFEVVSSDARSTRGTFAFFKAYQELPDNIDAVYINSLWGMHADMIREFFKSTNRDRVPVFSAEGSFHVSRGAFASNSGHTPFAEGMIAARKALSIIAGARPADLPVFAQPNEGLALNEETARLCRIELDDYIAASADLISEGTSPETVRLESAIGQAIAINPGYLAVYDAIEASSAEASRAMAAYMPQVSLNAGLSYFDKNYVHNTYDEESRTQVTGGVELYQQLFSLPTIRAIEQSRRSRDSVSVGLDHARLDLERAVSLAFMNLYQAREVLELEVRSRRFLDKFLEYAALRQMLRLDDGSIAATRLQSERAAAVARILQARANVEVARTLYNRLLAQPGESEFVPDPDNFSSRIMAADFHRLRPLIANHSDKERLVGLLTGEAFESNLDLRTSALRVGLQEGRLSQVSAGYYPSIGFTASLDYQDKLDDLGGTFEEKATSWSIGAGLRWSVFEGGGRRQERKMQAALLREMESRREDLRLGVHADIRRALYAFAARLNAGGPHQLAAERAGAYVVRLVEDRNTDLPVILDALNNDRRAHLEELENRMQYFTEALNLVSVLGWSLYDRNSLPQLEVANFITANAQP